MIHVLRDDDGTPVRVDSEDGVRLELANAFGSDAVYLVDWWVRDEPVPARADLRAAKLFRVARRSGLAILAEPHVTRRLVTAPVRLYGPPALALALSAVAVSLALWGLL